MNTKIMILLVMTLPFAGSLGSWMIGRKNEKVRDFFNIVLTSVIFLLVTMVFPIIRRGEIDFSLPHFMGVGVDIKLDMLRYILLWMTTAIWALATIYSTQYLTRYKNRNRYYGFFLLTLGSTMGVFLAGDILSLLMFFEVMSFTSYVLVIHDEDDNAHEAGRTYLVMAIIGGLLLLTGIFLLFQNVEVLNLDAIRLRVRELGNIKYTISILLILGFGIKAGMFPLHIWLPKAYAASPSPASAVLSGVLAKTGTFGIIITVSMLLNDSHVIVNLILILGFITMFLGGFFALFQTNIKRILAYSSMSQMGYILVGIGLMGILKEDGAVAVQGTIYHMFNHGIFKGLLFFCVGLIYTGTHILDINELKGFGRKYPITGLCFLIGLFGITGVPGFNGFISKSLLHEALSEAHHLYHSNWFIAAEWIFTISSGMTVAYMLKIFMKVFIEKEKLENISYRMKLCFRSIVPTTLLAIMIAYIGLFPRFIYNLMGDAVEILGYSSHGAGEISFFSYGNLKAVLLSYCIGVGIYVFVINGFLRNKGGDYYNPIPKNFSIEKIIYIPMGKGIFAIGHHIFHSLENVINFSYNQLDRISNVFKAFKHDKKDEEKEIILKLEDVEELSVEGRRFSKMPSVERIVSFSQELGLKANSITVSIYIFASMVIVILLAFILQNYNIML